jgi:limonene-1,2-epoxide hydrolase
LNRPATSEKMTIMSKIISEVTRRRFLAAGGLATAALAGAGAARAATPTDQERLNVELVEAACAAWSTLDASKVAAFFSDNCALRFSETSPWVTGREAILQKITGVVAGAEKVELELLDVYPKGPIVLNERMDRTTKQGRTRPFHVAGIILIKDGKIAEWNDYAIR